MKMDEAIRNPPVTPDAYTRYFSELQQAIAHLPCSYPKDYQRVDEKTKTLRSNLDFFKGCDVVDIGSNFGMLSFFSGVYAKTVHGVERDGEIFEISLAAKAFFAAQSFHLDNVHFTNAPVKKLAEINYNALLASLVLYHLNDEEIDFLIADAERKCEKIILQCRPGRARSFMEGRLTDHVSVNTKFNGLYDIADNVKFLHALGFKNIRIDTNPELFANELFPVLLAWK